MEKEAFIDKDKPCLGFEGYRAFLDSEPGLIRHGIESEDIYKACLIDDRTLFGGSAISNDLVVLGASNEILHCVESSAPISEKLFSALPSYHVFKDNSSEKSMIFRDSLTLSAETTTSIFLGASNIAELVDQEIHGDLEGRKQTHCGNTYNEYMFMTKYDLKSTHEKFSQPAHDIETPNGFIVTTNREEIIKNLPQIVKLQGDVFKSQAIQTGYFAGLGDQETIDIINNPEFIPIIARDKTTGEVAMCTLFAPDFTSFDTLPWINPNEVGRHLLKGPVPDCLTLPLIVISKNSGLGLLKYAVQMAMHETVYRKRPDTVAVMYESNPISIYVTPRTIHGQILRAGGNCIYQHAEAYYFSELE